MFTDTEAYHARLMSDKVCSMVLATLCVLFSQIGLAGNADFKEFTVTWSGAEFGNDATAEASVTLDMNRIENPGTSSGTDFMEALSITVKGAAKGNGTWTKADYGFFRLTTTSQPMDFSRELVGQNDWGIVVETDQDFKLSPGSNGSPESVNSFIIRADGVKGDRMRLVSFKPASLISTLALKADFSEGNGSGVDERVYALAEDSQGRLVVGGLFRDGVARFLEGGDEDSHFFAGGGIGGGTFGYVTGLVVLSDDSIVAVGDFTDYDGNPRGRIVKILPDGAIDESFATGSGADAIIRCIERLPDGRFLIGGEFTEYDGISRSRIARLDENGTLDPSFDTDDVFEDSDDYVDEIELLPNGSFLAAGRFQEYGGRATRNVARIFANGDVDPSFESPDNPGDYVEAMKVLSSGKILLGSSNGGQIIFRLEEDGARDADFDPVLHGSGVYGLLELDGGRVMVSGLFTAPESDGHTNLVILNEDGSVDEDGFHSEITPDGWVGPLLKSTNGSIYAGGQFSRINGRDYGHLARFGAFSPDVSFASPTGTIREGEGKEFTINVGSSLLDVAQFRITVESDDTAVIPRVNAQNGFTVFPGENPERISVYFENDQSINGDRTFRLRITPESAGATVGTPDFMTITVTDDEVPGTVFLGSAGGVLNESRGSTEVKVKRFTNDPGELSVKIRTVDGSAIAGRDYVHLDTTVIFPAGVYEKTVAIAGAPASPEITPLRRFGIELYAPGEGAILGNPASANIDINDKDDPGSSVVDFTIPDAGSFFRCNDLKLSPNGDLYALATYIINTPQRFETRILSFDSSGTGRAITIPDNGSRKPDAYSLAFGFDGKIYVAGTASILRFLSDGNIDESWANPLQYVTPSPTRINDILPLPDGKVLICGSFNAPIEGLVRQPVARLMPDGSLDPTFDMGDATGGRVVHEMALDRSGKILLVGTFSSIQGIARTNVVRISQDGTIDESFDASSAISSQGLNTYTNHIAIAPDGKIYLGGNERIIRVNGNGSLDTEFARVDGTDFSIQPDGKLLVATLSNTIGAKRVDTSGVTDESFAIYSSPHSPIRSVTTVELGADGRAYFGGEFTMFDGIPAANIACVQGGSGSVAGTIDWDTNTLTIGEGIGERAVLIRRTDSSQGNVGVHFTLVADSAEKGTDVVALSGYREFLPGESGHEVRFNILDDSILENTESFRLVLHNPSGGARTESPGSLNVEIADDDGDDLASWITRYNPTNPLDPTLPYGDPDGDGVQTFVEWMTDSDPTKSGDAKQPLAGFHEIDTSGSAEERFGITFYLNPSKTGFRTIVEQSESLAADSWSPIWDSSVDPALQSDLISGEPLVAPGWISILSPDSLTTKGFLRLRYEAR